MQTIRGWVREPVDLVFTSNGIALATIWLVASECKLYKVVAWRNLAEQCNQILDENDTVMVSGYTKTNSYTTHKGNTETEEVFNADKMWLVSGESPDKEQFIDVMELERPQEAS